MDFEFEHSTYLVGNAINSESFTMFLTPATMTKSKGQLLTPTPIYDIDIIQSSQGHVLNSTACKIVHHRYQLWQVVVFLINCLVHEYVVLRV